jgi:aminoglycoside phosphotransferase (APT) family kinase protein
VLGSPPADIEIDRSLVRGLLRDQCPDLAELPLLHLDAGWDNVLWRLGDDLTVRLPRREIASYLTANEQRWLPELAPRLPLPVPAPVRIGRPSDRFPWPWSVVPWLTGEPGDRAAVGDAPVAAEQLGRFLRALHTEAPEDAPRNPWRGVPLIERVEMFEERMLELGDQVDVPGLRRVWGAATTAPAFAGAQRWIHGDLHPANVLIDQGRLAGVIDFGDLCAGDPATDLAGFWMLLPASALGRFAAGYGAAGYGAAGYGAAGYGALDEALVTRSLGWATLYALMFLSIGLRDKPTYEPIGRATLERVVAFVP